MDLFSIYFGKGFAGVREIMFTHLILPGNDPDVTCVAKRRRRHMKNQKQHKRDFVTKNPYKGKHPTTVSHKHLRLLAQTCRFWHEKVKKFRWKICPKVMHVEVVTMNKIVSDKKRLKELDKKHEKYFDKIRMGHLLEWLDSL